MNAWLQYGHALKELNQADRARDAYARANALAPARPEPLLELAHAEKIAGRFEAARTLFERARDVGHPDAGGIAAEIERIARLGNPAHPAVRSIATAAPDSVHVWLSVPGGAVADGSTATLDALGRTDYSYAFAMRGFARALEQLRVNHTILIDPEAVRDIKERSPEAIDIHLGFYPPERLRLLKGAYNIACFAWEFDRLRLPGETTSNHAFADQTTMLSLCDEIWVPSAHGAGAVSASLGNSRTVRAVPSPVLDGHLGPRPARPDAARVASLAQRLRRMAWQPLSVLHREQDRMNEAAAARETDLPAIVRSCGTGVGGRPTLFVTVLNVHDMRKQLKPMLQAFVDVTQRRRDALLLVKMTSPLKGQHPINSFIVGEQLADGAELTPMLVSDRIWITDQNLTRDELNGLYDIAAFYLCTSHAEGQNLPLIEAMARGVVPVSVDHTAMADYIDESSAIPIASHRRPLTPRLSTRYGLYGIETNFVDAGDVRRSLERAMALDNAGYASRSAASVAAVGRVYGAAPVADALGAVVASLGRSLR